MATSLTSSTTNYWLLFAHPDPESAERVCIGLILAEHGRATLLFDPALSKLRCVAPDYDFVLLRYYLDDLRMQLQSSSSVETVLSRYSLALSTSEPRRAADDLSDEQKQMLLDRFTGKALSSEAIVISQEMVARRTRPASDERIKAFVEKSASQTRFRVVQNAQASDLFGYSTKRIRSVAVGLVGADEVILVDGVDLNVMTPARANVRTEQIVRTFWQYRRLQEEQLSTQRLHRVGVVMNGTAAKTRAEQDAHDYAFELFQKESDLAVDASREQGVNEFRDLLATRQ